MADIALFVDLVKSGNMSRGAVTSGVALSTLSRRIAALEKTLGVKLVDRSTRRFQLTEDGEQYYAALESLFARAKIAIEELRHSSEQLRGRLRIGATPDFGTHYLGPIISDFAHLHPELELIIDLSPKPANLISDRFDVTIHMGQLPDSTLTVRRLARVSTGIFASPAYLESRPALLHPGDLAPHNLISLPHQKNAWKLQSAGETVTVTARGRFLTNNVSFVRHLAVSGHGIGAIGDLIAQPDLAAGRLVQVLPQWRLEPVPVLAVTASKMLSPRARTFVEFLAERLRPLDEG